MISSKKKVVKKSGKKKASKKKVAKKVSTAKQPRASTGRFVKANGSSSVPPTTKRKITHFGLVLDRSGSMSSIMETAKKACEENVRTLDSSTRAAGQAASISFLSFDDLLDPIVTSRADNFRVPSQVYPRGTTALFDATQSIVKHLQRIPVDDDNEDVSYLVTVVTDGWDNASRPSPETAAKQLKTLIQDVQRTDKWTLSFLLPIGNKEQFVTKFGIPDGNVMEWEATVEGVKAYAAATHVAVNNYVVTRSAGLHSTKTFYTDLSNVTKKDIAQLADLSKNVKILHVKNDSVIRDFIEASGETFIKGAEFYQLVPGKKSADIVQDYKQVLVRDKVSGKVYGGADARQVLGLPLSETRIRPGDHGNFDIFIQSTSYTRKLKAGTKVIHAPQLVS